MPSLSRPTATHDDDDVALFSRPFSSENLTTSLHLFRDSLVKANDDEVDKVIEQSLSKVISAIEEKANFWKRMRKRRGVSRQDVLLHACHVFFFLPGVSNLSDSSLSPSFCDFAGHEKL